MCGSQGYAYVFRMSFLLWLPFTGTIVEHNIRIEWKNTLKTFVYVYLEFCFAWISDKYTFYII